MSTCPTGKPIHVSSLKDVKTMAAEVTQLEIYYISHAHIPQQFFLLQLPHSYTPTLLQVER